MTRRIVAVVTRALNAQATTTAQDHETPHFHQGAQGNPAACFEPRCSRPQLDV
jgi:hypothetical protein